MYRIGICDDDAVFTKYIERLFKEEGIEAEFYEYLSGEELVQDVKERYFIAQEKMKFILQLEN